MMIFLKNVGRGIQYFQISIRYQIVQALNRTVKRINNNSWICQIFSKYVYGLNDIKEIFIFIVDNQYQICKIFIPVDIHFHINTLFARKIEAQ